MNSEFFNPVHRSGAGSGAAGRVLARLPADRTARHTYTRQSVSYFTVPPRAHPSTDTHPHSPMRHFKSNIRFPVAASERAVDHDGGLHSRATSALHKDRTFHRPVQKSCFAIRR